MTPDPIAPLLYYVGSGIALVILALCAGAMCLVFLHLYDSWRRR